MIEWASAVNKHLGEHSTQEHQLVREGLELFFRTVTSLPNLDSQPRKYWKDYEIPEIQFVTFSASDERVASVRGFLDSHQEYQVGIFDVRDDKTDAHKGYVNQSARVLLQPVSSGKAFDKIIFSVSYRTPGEGRFSFARSISIIHPREFSIEDGVKKGYKEDNSLEGVPELEFLRLVNCLALVYLEEIKSQRVHTPA